MRPCYEALDVLELEASRQSREGSNKTRGWGRGELLVCVKPKEGRDSKKRDVLVQEFTIRAQLRGQVVEEEGRTITGH